jgi:hypothetical protein
MTLVGTAPTDQAPAANHGFSLFGLPVPVASTQRRRLAKTPTISHMPDVVCPVNSPVRRRTAAPHCPEVAARRAPHFAVVSFWRYRLAHCSWIRAATMSWR